MRILSWTTAVIAMMYLSSCATIVNFDNNKKLKMGIDVITEKDDPITVTVNGQEAKHFRQYDGDTYNVDYVVLKKATHKVNLTITQNGVTKSGTFIGNKAEGMFWIDWLFIFVDHATGALRQYPAVRFEDMQELNAGK